MKTTKPNLQAVAKKAGVSLPTASQVIRGVGRISEPTRKKVLKVAQELNYVRDSRAASMRLGESKEIGMLVQNIANPFNAEVISGVSSYLETKGYFVSILDNHSNSEYETKHLEAFISSARAGVIWVPTTNVAKRSLDILENYKTPTVTFLRKTENVKFDHVGIENRTGAYTATEHLISLGHKHIAFFGGDENTSVRQERISGYRKSMNENKLEANFLVWDCEDSKKAGIDSSVEFFEKYPQVTALVCNGDMVALGVCITLKRFGKIPGKEISVIGFDNILDSKAAYPQLTTMDVQPVQLGRAVAKVLLDRIKDPSIPIFNLTLPATLIKRETTGKLQNT